MNRRTFQPVQAIYVKAKWCEDKRVIIKEMFWTNEMQNQRWSTDVEEEWGRQVIFLKVASILSRYGKSLKKFKRVSEVHDQVFVLDQPLGSCIGNGFEDMQILPGKLMVAYIYIQLRDKE